jgi:hypothetical protein
MTGEQLDRLLAERQCERLIIDFVRRLDLGEPRPARPSGSWPRGRERTARRLPEISGGAASWDRQQRHGRALALHAGVVAGDAVVMVAGASAWPTGKASEGYG